MKTEKREVFVADDGKVFETIEACQAHERSELDKAKRISGLRVWRVNSAFDGTEGRGYYHLTYIVTDASFGELLQYCFDRYGNPLSSWYGDGYFEEWRLTLIENMTAGDAIHQSTSHHSGVGGTAAKVDLVFLSKADIDHPNLPARVFPWPRKAKP